MRNEIDLYYMISQYRETQDKNDAFNEIFILFKPLLTKYAYKLGDIDYKYYLAEALFSAVERIPIHKPQFKDNRYILAYIKKSVVAEYIKLSQSQKKNEYCSTAEILDSTSFYSYQHLNDGFESFWFSELVNAIISGLTAHEYEVFKLRYELGYSESEIAAMFGISRQAVNKKIKNIKFKICNMSQKSEVV